MKTTLTRFLAFTAMIGSLLTFAPDASAIDDVEFGRVHAHSSVNYYFTASRGDDTTILVSGDGDTDLDAFLYDSSGRLIDSDIDGTDTCLLTVVPGYTDRFKIVIVNHGRVFNDFSIAID